MIIRGLNPKIHDPLLVKKALSFKRHENKVTSIEGSHCKYFILSFHQYGLARAFNKKKKFISKMCPAERHLSYLSIIIYYDKIIASLSGLVLFYLLR